MSNYKSLIDEAMRTAQYRLNSGVEKTASAPNHSSIVKEASELANALEYMSIASNNNGSLAGAARAEIIRDFHKSATAQRLGVKLAGDVGESSTHIKGVQGIAPSSGKIKLTKNQGELLVSSAPDSTGNQMLESYKQAEGEGTTLYDILMHQKEAGDVGEMDAEMAAPGIPSKNENSNRSILEDSYVLQGVSKQEAKAPVRARLAEAFAATSDTLGDQTVKNLFPTAYSQGGLKKTAGLYLNPRAKTLFTKYKATAQNLTKKPLNKQYGKFKKTAASFSSTKRALVAAKKEKLRAMRLAKLQKATDYKPAKARALNKSNYKDFMKTREQQRAARDKALYGKLPTR